MEATHRWGLRETVFYILLLKPVDLIKSGLLIGLNKCSLSLTVTRVKPQVGWYVGYIETPMDVWFFATNIEVRDKQDLPLRQQLTRDALQAKEVIK